MTEEDWEQKIEIERRARSRAESSLEIKNRELSMANEQQKALAEALRIEKETNKAILDNVAEGIVTFDPDGTIRSLNKAAEDVFGIPVQEAIERKFESLFVELDPTIYGCTAPSEICFEAHAEIEPGKTRDLEVTLSRPESTHLQFFIAIVRDRTERRELESQLALAQKMESVGQLAAGIAHEINTPIQYVGDNARFLQQAFDDIHGLIALYEELVESVPDKNEIFQEKVNNIEALRDSVDLEFLKNEVPLAVEQSLIGTERVAKIVHAMKEFSHPGTDQPISFDLNQALMSAATVSRNEWKYVAQLESDFDESEPVLTGFPADLNQVFLNIIVNAAHAIETRTDEDGTDNGVIRLCTRKVDDGVEVKIEDNGCGIDDAIQNRVFEPFFTTKPQGKGTGQGLDIVRRIVCQKHGGSVHLESKPNVGTVLTLFLPTIPGSVEADDQMTGELQNG